MGIIDDEGNIKQPSQFWDLGVIAIAAIFSSCIIGLWFFSFKVPQDKPATEVSVGIGQGSTIHSSPPPVSIIGPGPKKPPPSDP